MRFILGLAERIQDFISIPVVDRPKHGRSTADATWFMLHDVSPWFIRSICAPLVRDAYGSGRPSRDGPNHTTRLTPYYAALRSAFTLATMASCAVFSAFVASCRFLMPVSILFSPTADSALMTRFA